MMIMVGDTFHNFVDGVLIAAAFLADPKLGLVTALAIIAHEIPQEVGDFLVLLHSGFTQAPGAVVQSGFQSAAMVLGGLLGYSALNALPGWVPYLLGFVAASMIYVAVADLIPGLHRRPELKITLQQVQSDRARDRDRSGWCARSPSARVVDRMRSRSTHNTRQIAACPARPATSANPEHAETLRTMAARIHRPLAGCIDRMTGPADAGVSPGSRSARAKSRSAITGSIWSCGCICSARDLRLPTARSAPSAGDHRFDAPDWNALPWFRYLKQTYLINARWLTRAARARRAPTRRASDAPHFVLRQYLDALAPTQFRGDQSRGDPPRVRKPKARVWRRASSTCAAISRAGASR